MATVDLKSISHLLYASGIDSTMPDAADNRSSSDTSKANDRWEEIFSRLQKWLKSPECEDEDGYVSPSTKSISAASEILNAMRSESFPVPTWAIANGERGIVIELERESRKIAIEIDEEGSRELRLFENNKLIEQRNLELAD